MNTDATRWQRATALFDRLLELDDDERRRVLDAECGDDPVLRSRVERLLQADADAGHLDNGIDEFAGAILRASDAAARIGKSFGPYRIVRVIGHGGMGEVYLAERQDADFEQIVALKLMRTGAGGVDGRRRFLDERRLLAKLEHPNIARLYDGGFGVDGQPWYAMEYIDGAPVTRDCDDARMPLHARLLLFAKVCEAVDHAHRHLIVHRDIKPANILVDLRGEPRLLDFGIAKLLVSADADSGGETALMTPEYAAPEQLRGEAVSIATDVYSLGAVLFEALTGRRPFSDALSSREPPQASRACADGTPDLPARAAARGLRAPGALRKALRGDLDRILMTALAPEPERRYRSASALADDLRAVADGRPISLRGDRRYRLGKFVRRHRWGVAAASVAVIALLATSTVALWQAERAQERARTALAVKDFVAGLLASSSPEVSLGRQLTVHEVLDRGRQQLPQQLADEPTVAIELLTLMARSYMALGDHRAAQALLDHGRMLAPKVDPDRRADLYGARLDLALHAGHEDATRAEAVALRSLLPRVRDAGSRVSALLTLADYEAEALGKSEGLAAEALQLAEAALPEGDQRRIRALRILADSKLEQGKRDEARALQEQALALATRHLPRLHPEATTLQSDLITHYMNDDRDSQAITLARRVLADSIAVYGETSLNTAHSRLTLGKALRRAGSYRDAYPHHAHALRMYERMPAKSMEEQAAAEFLLAECMEALGNLAGAQRLYQRAYDHYSATGREQHSLPYLQLAVAQVMAKRGLPREAGVLYRRIADTARPGSGSHGLALSGLGTVARHEGDVAQALTLHQRAIDLLGRKTSSVYRSMQLPLLGAQLELARDQALLGQVDSSRATLVAIVGTLDANFPYEAPDLVEAYFELAPLIDAPAEARRLLNRGAALRAQMYGQDDPRARAGREALAAHARG